ncbi:DUF6258 family protein [Buttiauxella izardii]|uniref:Uncharacterized protein n=1 Tax=Buttiauxella izardii TaxID=82991 RepID=A0A3A5JUG7_9ENTR|nr:DUF6258 family protein [Buttiauxella izardii]RJT20238.1 hypothetical protein D6029_17035 [Buttiauxella izardii]
MIDRIYLGDRAVKGIEIDSWELIVRIRINSISRLPEGGAEWNFYNEEDLENGYMVFSNVSDFQINPPGSIPDDYVVDYSFTKISDREFLFKMYSGGQVPSSPQQMGECEILITHEDSWLENSLKEKID